MIEVKLSSAVATAEQNYPCLKEVIGKKWCIVLFNNHRRGIVVSSIGLWGCRVGEYSATWNEEDFQLYNGEITLSNSK